MSLGIVIAGPEGLVLAAESRLTLTATNAQGEKLPVFYDNATKLLAFSEPNTSIGAVTYGMAAIAQRTASSFMPEFEATLPAGRLQVREFAQLMSDFFVGQWDALMPKAAWKGAPMKFTVGGFDDGRPYGEIHEFSIPDKPSPKALAEAGDFAISWGGQREWVDRLIQGYDEKVPGLIGKALKLDGSQNAIVAKVLAGLSMNLPIQAMALQDCVDLAIFVIRTTIEAQKLTVGIRGVGGHIDVATITRREGLQFIQRKKVVGEKATYRTT